MPEVSNIWTTLTAYQGVIGATVGAIVGFAVSESFKHMGKMRVYFVKQELKFYNIKSNLGMEKVCSIEKSEYGHLNFWIELYNTKAYPISFREVRVEIEGKDRLHIMPVIVNEGLKHYTSMSLPIRSDVINLIPKTMEHHELDVSLDKKALQFIMESKQDVKYYFCLTMPKGKKKRMRIPVNYSEPE